MFAIQPFETDETTRQPDWQELARCNDGTGSMTELFFSEQLDDIAAAKAFCLECPVKEMCLEGATDRRETWTASPVVHRCESRPAERRLPSSRGDTFRRPNSECPNSECPNSRRPTG